MPDLVHGNTAERQARSSFKLSNIHLIPQVKAKMGVHVQGDFMMVPEWHEQMSILCRYIMYISPIYTSTKWWQGQ
jgi:hypothetical protein